MSSPISATEYGKYIDLQAYDAASPENSGSIYLSGAAGAEIVHLNVGMQTPGKVEAGSSFIIGAADLDETDLEKLDGITNGTVAANKAVVVDANKDADGFRHLIATGDVEAGTAFVIGAAEMSEADLEKLDDITNGAAAANKALVLDANKDASGLRDLSGRTFSGSGDATFAGAAAFGGAGSFGGSVTAGSSFIIGSADLNETDLEKLDGITDGTVAANKAVVVDANLDASGFRHVTATGAVTAGTSFVIGSADLDETDLEKLDGITDGTAAANKALVLDASLDASGINSLSTSMFTASYARIGTLDVTTINSVTETATTLEVADKKVVSALSASSAAADGGGFQIGGGSGDDGHASVTWSDADSALEVAVGSTGVAMFMADGVEISTDLLPESDDARDLGAVGQEWKDLHLDGVAYVDELRADLLGAALDANSQAITNINVDSGVIDGTVIGGSSAAAATFTTVSGSGAATFASLTSDSVDLNGGAIDGTVIGANSAAAGDFTALAATSLDLQGGDLSDAGDVNVDSISAAATDFDLLLSDNSATALEIKEGTNAYMTFDTTNAAELMTMHKEVQMVDVVMMADDKQIYFGDDDDASIEFVSAAGQLKLVGAASGIHMASATAFGADGAGVNVVMYGASANESMQYSAADHRLKFQDAAGSVWMQLGGDADSEYAIDVAEGSNQKNKIRAAAFVTYSDERLKTDVTAIENGLETVNSLKAVNFTWKKDGSRDFGFMAQELKQVVPQAVHGSEEGLFGVDYGRLSAILVSAIQEQSAQIASLKKQLENK